MMLERDEHTLRRLAGVDIQLTAGGRPPGPWPAGRRLTTGPAPGLKPPDTGPGRRAGGRLVLRGKDLPLPAEVIPASAVGTIWVYKKGSHVFIRPLADITRYWHGIPFLAPEVVLLIKARPGLDRPGAGEDQRDFEAALPMLSAQQRSWLKDAIERPSWLKDAIERRPRPPPAPVDTGAGRGPSPASVIPARNSQTGNQTSSLRAAGSPAAVPTPPQELVAGTAAGFSCGTRLPIPHQRGTHIGRKKHR